MNILLKYIHRRSVLEHVRVVDGRINDAYVKNRADRDHLIVQTAEGSDRSRKRSDAGGGRD